MPLAERQFQDLLRNMVDRGVHLLFDWVVEPPGTLTKPVYRLFSNPVGLHRSPDETSMYLSEHLPAPEGFQARSVHAFYGSMFPGDRELFRERYSLTLWVLHKNVWRAPLVAIPLQGLMFPWVNEEPVDWPQQANTLEPFPRYIPSMCQFYMELTGEPVKLDLGLRFLPAINGYLDRGVQ
jgi:hypothetical protein